MNDFYSSTPTNGDSNSIAFGIVPFFKLMPEKKAEPNNLCLIKSRQNLSNLGQFQALKSRLN